MNLASRLSLTLAALAALGLAALPSQADTTIQSIGIKLGADGTSTLGSTESAGFFAQTNWNNFGGNNGSGLTLNDNSGGVVTGATLSYSGAYTFTTNNPPFDQSTPDKKLLSSHLEINSVDSPASVTVSGLNFGTYDVYAYFGSDSDNRTGSVNIGGIAGTTYDYKTVGDPSGLFSLTTDTKGAYPNADYAHFTGLTGGSFTLTQSLTGPSPYSNGLYGLQIVNTSPLPPASPEPSQLAGLAFTAFGALGLVLKARKRKAGAVTA